MSETCVSVYMDFRTAMQPLKASFNLSPRRPVVLLGSCFAQNVAERMRGCIWNAVNPTGALYNPLSILRTLNLILFSYDPEGEFEQSLFKSASSCVNSWLFDSKISAHTIEDCKKNFNTARATVAEALSEAEAMIITFGTSWCYYLNSVDSDLRSNDFADGSETEIEFHQRNIVANCHKMPSSMFIRRRLTISEICESWRNMAERLHSRFPNLRIIFTVSPVRHLKDGFSGNSRSKAILQLAIEEICEHLEYCSYFPAYEILNDDLRDYRFYASDMVHPSESAIEYIWNFFCQTYVNTEGMQILREGEKIFKLCNHRGLLETEEDTHRRLDRAGHLLAEFCKKYDIDVSSNSGLYKILERQ